MARGWTIGGVGEPTRAAVTAAASEAGISLGQWVEQALKKALAEGLEPGVRLGDRGAAAPGRGRCGTTGAGTIARIELATAPSSPDIRLLRERLRQRQGW